MKSTEGNTFLVKVIQHIRNTNTLHAKKVEKNILEMRQMYVAEFHDILALVTAFFSARRMSPERVAGDYLKMINDMLVEGIRFKKTRQYSCKTQQDAYLQVYSKPDVMEYYMNALLLSQILWAHHFKMLMYFRGQLSDALFSETKNVLDIGPGHGFYSYLVKQRLASADSIDIVDISDDSLRMTRTIIGDGEGMIRYFREDIINYSTTKKYDLIILGEVLEHLDNPMALLHKLGGLLNFNGHLWLTTPTNAPALDHIYLFRSRQEIVDLLENAGYLLVRDYGCLSEDVSDEIAEKFDVSFLFGAFLRFQVNR